MEQAIQVLSILDCKDSANYYKQGLQELIKESWKESGTEIGNSLEFDFVVPPPHSWVGM